MYVGGDIHASRALPSAEWSAERLGSRPFAGTPIEDRVEFPSEWKVGSENGLVHDGLQADGYIELRFDWKAVNKNGESVTKTALLRVNPWLAYGCGEGARLATRKPGATESTAGTLQRTLRDDYVVVRRDGSDSELTVDPTPFTVVPASNPRHQPGTRLLIVYENKCMDATVEQWPEGEVATKDGSRHELKVEPLQISGWVTMVKEETHNLVRRGQEPVEVAPASPAKGTKAATERKDDTAAAEAKAGAPAAAKVGGKAATERKAGAAAGGKPADEADAAKGAKGAGGDKKGGAKADDGAKADEGAKAVAAEGGGGEEAEEAAAAPGMEEEIDLSGVWVTTHMLKLRSGCDPATAELGNLKSKLPVTILERRLTPNGVRAYISTIPSESHIQVTMALNEFNHSVQRFSSVSAYEGRPHAPYPPPPQALERPGEPSSGQRERAACERAACERAACERVACERVACERVACERAACERVACERVACERAACVRVACERARSGSCPECWPNGLSILRAWLTLPLLASPRVCAQARAPTIWRTSSCARRTWRTPSLATTCASRTRRCTFLRRPRSKITTAQSPPSGMCPT